jgi:hypothetical protein
MQIRMEKFTAPICEWLNRCDNSSVEVFVEKLQEITAPDERTPVAVEIIGQVNFSELKQTSGMPSLRRHGEKRSGDEISIRPISRRGYAWGKTKTAFRLAQ